MTRTSPLSSQERQSDEDRSDDTVKLQVINTSIAKDHLDKEMSQLSAVGNETTLQETCTNQKPAGEVITYSLAEAAVATEQAFIAAMDTKKLVSLCWDEPIDMLDTDQSISIMPSAEHTIEVVPAEHTIEEQRTVQLAHTDTASAPQKPLEPVAPLRRPTLTRGRALLLAAFLLVLILNASNLGNTQFIGAQGWAYVLGGPASSGDPNLLKNIANLLQATPKPGAKTQPTHQITPQDYINFIVNHMSLAQKLGQMMIVQFVGPDYGLEISTMVTQYNVGAVLIFPANNNVVSKTQLKGLIQQMQSNSAIPLAVAIDQEGGTVDRLVKLDGTRRSATAIGLTNDPAQATAAGVQDAKDLSSYGINLNLAPVVDVTNVYNSQMYLRTFGDNPTLVTKMAAAYLQGLQQSGKVLGTLKHFPGLGDVAADPHSSVPHLSRSLNQLEAIDWAPYRSLIQQGNIHAIMVTHEIVSAVDASKPSSLSYKLVTDILRDQLGFNGVIMTDSLTMEGITAYYTEAQAAALAIEAGSDILMGASTSNDVANMITGIKQAMAAGEISQQRIDDSVRRILMLKYQMGLLHIPTT
ncbi:MAG: glycoside hydrolase family 3 protein [Ktedonobacteraceae bacterium]